MNLRSSIMPQETFLKCSCKHCAGNMEFPSEGLGQTIRCPHCGEETQLVGCVEAPVNPRSVRKQTILLAVLIPISLAAAMALGIFVEKEKPDPASTGKAPPVEIKSETTTDAAPKKFKRRKKPTAKPVAQWNGMQPGNVTLEKSGGRLVYAVGTIRNDSDHQRFSVTVELDVFDGQDAKLGSSSDYTPVIEPQKEWKFKALVIDPKAVRAEITAIKEN